MRSILLHIQDDDGLESRLQVALDIARQFDGHLTCVQAVSYDLAVAGDYDGTMAAQMAAEYIKIARNVRKRLESHLSGEDVAWEWLQCDGSAVMALSNYAPLNDLLVLGAHTLDGRSDRPSALVSEMVGQVRCPVLVVSVGAGRFTLETPAMVAWNGSAESGHSLCAAMPMLLRASEVHILSVQEEKDTDRHDIPRTGAAKYLARHGIEAEIVDLPLDAGQSIAKTLTDAAESRKAGYLAMGAYGHSRLRERILGGVTRDMLSDSKIPLLLSH